MRVRLIVLFAIFFAISARAQKTITTLSFQLSFPQGAYLSASPKTGAGLRWNVLHRFNEDIPLSIGGEIGFLVKGSTAKEFDLYYAGFYDRYRISASNNIVSIAFKTRADLIRGHKKPQVFIDATIGTNLFYSSVNVERETDFSGSQVVDGNSTKAYWAFVFGPGIGIEIPLGKRKETGFLLKASYLYGSSTKYFTDPYIDTNGEVYFTQHESKTDAILFETGIRIGIFGR